MLCLPSRIFLDEVCGVNINDFTRLDLTTPVPLHPLYFYIFPKLLSCYHSPILDLGGIQHICPFYYKHAMLSRHILQTRSASLRSSTSFAYQASRLQPAYRRHASLDAGENDSGHISSGPNEGVIFLNSTTPSADACFSYLTSQQIYTLSHCNGYTFAFHWLLATV